MRIVGAGEEVVEGLDDAGVHQHSETAGAGGDRNIVVGRRVLPLHPHGRRLGAAEQLAPVVRDELLDDGGGGGNEGGLKHSDLFRTSEEFGMNLNKETFIDHPKYSISEVQLG